MAFTLSACTGPTGGQKPRREAPEEQPEQLPEAQINMAEYETFDPAPYRLPAPTANEPIKHDVPETLMESRAAEGVTREVRGYRIQIFAAADRASANEAVETVMTWWNTAQQEAPEGLLPDQLPVYVEYHQPYYRVRLGNFVDRATAERALSYVQQRFEGAFITPGMVTVTR